MASDFDKQAALRWYLKNYKTQAEIEAIALQAFTDLQSGKTVTSVSFEGGSTSSIVNSDPGNLLSACQGALADLGVKPAELTTIFPKFNVHPLET